MSETLDYAIYKATFSNITTDTLCSFSGPGITGTSSNIPLYQVKPDWQAITMELVTTSLTGGTTKVVVKALTTNDISGGVVSTSPAAKLADNSTALSLTPTTTGSTAITTGRHASAGATSSPIGALLGVLLDATTLTDFDGAVYVYVS